MMDGSHFDHMIRSLASSRRSLLSGALALGAGWFGVPGTEAKKKRKPKKAQPNDFGCLNVGAACKTSGQCCSGICKGKNGKLRCRAHGTGTCGVGQTIGFCGGENVGCAIGGGNPTGVCGTTTGNAGFCVGGGDCFACSKDEECRPFCGPGAACVRCERCAETGGTMCASPGIHTCVFQ